MQSDSADSGMTQSEVESDPSLWSKIKEAYVNGDESILEFPPAQAYRRLLRETKSWFVPGRGPCDEADATALSPYEDLIFDTYNRVKNTLDLEPYVELARTITGMQMSFIGLIDREFYYLTAQAGCDAALDPIPRRSAICDYTMAQPRGCVTTFRDMPSDWRLENHPMNDGTVPGARRSYIGIPLTTVTGSNIGTICCLDTRPRKQGWQANEETGLKLIAELITRDLDLQVDRSLALQAQKVFVTSVNHELKTPVHGLLASAELLKAHRIGEHQETISTFETECISNIHHCSNTLIDVIDNVLHYNANNHGEESLSRSESPNGNASPKKGDPQATPVDLVQLLEQIIESSWAGKARNNNDLKAIFKADSAALGKSLLVNRGELSRIVLNIFGNAIKYTKKGFVLAELSTMPQTAGDVENHVENVRITVTDTGCGMPDKFVNNGDLFKPFVQLDTRSEGVGLGLSICKSFIERCNGKLAVRSEANLGTTMEISLPFKIDSSATGKRSFFDDIGMLTGRKFCLISSGESSLGAKKLQDCLEETCACQFGMVAVGAKDAEVVIAQSHTTVNEMIESGVPGPFLLVGSELKSRAPDHSSGALVTLVHLPLGPCKLFRALTQSFSLARADIKSPPIPQHDFRNSQPGHSQPGEQANGGHVTKDIGKSGTKRKLQDCEPKLHEARNKATKPDSSAKSTREGLPKVLCVDDNEINLRILTSVMAKQGVQYDTADDGDVAVAKYKRAESPINVIFMDIQMPRMGGLDACQEIREHERSNDLPAAQIIALSAGGKAQADLCFKAGMDGYCDKPVSIKILADIVNSWPRPSGYVAHVEQVGH